MEALYLTQLLEKLRQALLSGCSSPKSPGMERYQYLVDRRIDAPHWSGSVFRATWLPFAIVTVLGYLFGMLAQAVYPEARTVVELYRSIFPPQTP